VKLVSPLVRSVSELLYKEEIFQLVGLCMEIHRELGKGHDIKQVLNYLAPRNFVSVYWSISEAMELEWKELFCKHESHRDRHELRESSRTFMRSESTVRTLV
jgi:hypothetical protein